MRIYIVKKNHYIFSPKKMPFSRRKVAKKRVVRRKVTKKSATRKVPVAVKKYVKRALDNRIEDKEGAVTGSIGFWQQTTVSIISSYANSLIPSVAFGNTVSTRIGNEITVKKYMLKGYLYLNSSGLSAQNPYVPGQYHVRIFIGRLKRDFSTPLTSDYNVLLRTGAATLPFDSSSLLSLCRTVNRETWTIYYDKIHKIGTAGPANTGVTFNTDSGIANNDFSMTKAINIDCTKMIRKKLKFLDNNLLPTNTGLYIFGAVVNSLGSDNSLSSPPVILDYDIELKYEDA